MFFWCVCLVGDVSLVLHIFYFNLGLTIVLLTCWDRTPSLSRVVSSPLPPHLTASVCSAGPSVVIFVLPFPSAVPPLCFSSVHSLGPWSWFTNRDTFIPYFPGLRTLWFAALFSIVLLGQSLSSLLLGLCVDPLPVTSACASTGARARPRGHDISPGDITLTPGSSCASPLVTSTFMPLTRSI